MNVSNSALEAETAAASEPASATAPEPAAASEPEKHHVHHSYIWLGSLRTMVTLLVVVAVTSFSSFVSIFTEDGLNGLGEGLVLLGIIAALITAIVVVGALVVVYQVLSYRRLYFTLTPDEFNLYSGILNKRRVHVPYQRVQSVDQNASLLQRIFGVCTVSVDTAGGSSNKTVRVPYLTKQQAEWLRAELFARKRAVLMAGEAARAAVSQEAQTFAQASCGAVPAGTVASASSTASAQGVPHIAFVPPADQASSGNILDVGARAWQDVGGVFAGGSLDTGRVTYEYGLSNKELVLTGLSNNTAFVLIVLGLVGVVSQIADLLFGIFPKASESFVEGIATQATGAVAGGMVAALVAVALAVVVVLWLISAVVTCVGYGGFRARRRDNRIEMERGLLKHTFQGVDIDRVQAVIIKQTFIRRLMGYCEVSVSRIDAVEDSDSSLQSADGQIGVVIHPFVKLDRVSEILAGIIPEYDDLPVKSTPVAPVALRRALIRRCVWQGSGFWLAACVALVQVILNVAVGPGLIADVLDMDLMASQIALDAINTGAVVLYVIAAVLTIISAVGAFLWFRESSFAYNRRFMQISLGGFSRETMSFPRQKIQYALTRTNPFQRAAHTATISVRTAAGVGGTSVKLVDVAEEDARTWLDWVKPRGNAST